MRGSSYILWLGLALSACSSKSPGPDGTAGKTYRLRNGETVDCAALKALPPGETLMSLTRLTSDVADGQAALEVCLAEGPHLCDRAWVGWAVFGGVSMAVVEGVAPPLEQRARWFGDACRAMTPTDQACLLMSARMARGPAAAHDDPCGAPLERMRQALSDAQRAAGR